MTAFELVAKLVADTSSFDSAMNKAEKSGKNLQSSLSGTFGKVKKLVASALSVAAIKKGVDSVISLANEVSNAGDKIDKQSQVLGLSRKAYQEWDYILGQNGASIDSMSVSMKTLNSAILSAADGSEEYNEALVKLGLNYVELGDMNMEGQFEAVVRAFQKMPAGAKKSALAVKLFGRNGMELLPLLNQSETSIDELRQRAEELGIIMSDDAVNASVEYNDAMDDLNRTFNGIRNTFGAKLLPTFTSGVKKITAYAGKISKAYKTAGITGVLDTISESAGNIISKLKNSDSPVLQVLGSSLESIKTTIEIISSLIRDFDGTVSELQQSDKPVLQAVGNGLAAVKKVLEWIIANKETVAAGIGAIIAAFAAAKIATFVASISPLTVIFTLIAGAIALVATNWDKIKDWIGKAWKTTVTWINDKWNDVSSAFEIAKEWISEKANTIKLAWQSTVDEWATRINGWLTSALEIGISFGATVVGWFNTIKGWLEKQPSVLVDFGAKIAQWIQTIYDWAKNGINVAVNFLSSGLGGEANGVPTQSSFGTSLDTRENNQRSMQMMFGSLFGHAKGGLVPYDNYPALLHRGEQILTASQARHQESRSTIDLNGLASAVEAAIKSGMENVTVRSYLNGRNVTEEVNRTQIKQLKARRYAT